MMIVSVPADRLPGPVHQIPALVFDDCPDLEHEPLCDDVLRRPSGRKVVCDELEAGDGHAGEAASGCSGANLSGNNRTSSWVCRKRWPLATMTMASPPGTAKLRVATITGAGSAASSGRGCAPGGSGHSEGVSRRARSRWR